MRKSYAAHGAFEVRSVGILSDDDDELRTLFSSDSAFPWCLDSLRLESGHWNVFGTMPWTVPVAGNAAGLSKIARARASRRERERECECEGEGKGKCKAKACDGTLRVFPLSIWSFF